MEKRQTSSRTKVGYPFWWYSIEIFIFFEGGGVSLGLHSLNPGMKKPRGFQTEKPSLFSGEQAPIDGHWVKWHIVPTP